MVGYHLTPPIPRSFELLLSGTRYRLWPHTVPSPGCLSFPRSQHPAYTKPFWHPLYYFACSPCTRRTSTFPLSVSLVPKCLLRPQVWLLPQCATCARRTRRGGDLTSPLSPSLLGEPERVVLVLWQGFRVTAPHVFQNKTSVIDVFLLLTRSFIYFWRRKARRMIY